MPTDKETPEVKTEIEEKVIPAFEVELDDAAILQVETAVLAANEGKLKSDLQKEIAEATAAKLAEVREQSSSLLSKMEELSKDEANKDKSEDELKELAISAIEAEEKEKPEGKEKEEDTFKIIGDDFLGSAKSEDDNAAVVLDGIDNTALPEEVKVRLAKLDKLEKEDPVYKVFNEAKAANADIDFIGLIQQYGLSQDPSKAEPIVFKEIELKEMQKANPAITDEEIKDALDDFKDLGPLKQTQEIKSIKEYYVSQYAEAKKNFATKVSDLIGTDKESSKKIVTEAETALKAIEGKSYFGVKIEKSHSDKVLSAIRTGNGVYRNADGSVNMAKTVKANLMVEFGMDMFNALEEEAKKKIRQKVDHQRARPLSGLKVKRSGNVSSVDSRRELEEASKKLGRG